MKKQVKNTKNSVKILLNVPIEINNKFKELAESQGVPKSYLFVTALNYYLDYKDVMKSMPELLKAISSRSVSDNKRTK